MNAQQTFLSTHHSGLSTELSFHVGFTQTRPRSRAAVGLRAAADPRGIGWQSDL